MIFQLIMKGKTIWFYIFCTYLHDLIIYINYIKNVRNLLILIISFCRFQGTNTHRIIELVAEDSEAKGMFEDSVKLYDLAKKHDKVIELLNKLLAQVISLPPVAESRRDRLQKQAIDVAKRYRANGFAATEDASFFLL